MLQVTADVHTAVSDGDSPERRPDVEAHDVEPREGRHEAEVDPVPCANRAPITDECRTRARCCAPAPLGDRYIFFKWPNARRHRQYRFVVG
ncbi:hypothetical protein EVAR_46474_1 [Eumeta japonica]|uniref:Uncharacterized protein n=1 Tax=Eumeta variegata TaxID=151549 RepID=A0A4C1XKA1_EUMVA|nr:hypothetical protein EVAR_46474_1 [Eumeta japonica]